jgi:Domain of unknown function (DUF4864)
MVLPHVASAVRRVIRSQLDALRVHDAERALSCSTPGRQRYGTPAQFLEALARTVPQLVSSHSAEFEPPHEVDGRVAQPVRITSSDGSTLRALYLLEEQPDGQWLIDQCLCAGAPTPPRPVWVS